jgi:peptide/nickel transport system permease protein
LDFGLRDLNLQVRKLSAAHIVGWTIMALFVVAAIFADFLAPYDFRQQSRNEPSAPPSRIHFGLPPVVYQRQLVDPLRLTYVEDGSQAFAIRSFTRGSSFNFFGVQSDLHLFGVEGENAPRINLLGTDSVGRDRFSRVLHAIRFSLIVSSIGVVLACIIGVAIGVVSGYSSRTIDTTLMGATDAMLSLPTLILILAARAAFPLELPPFRAALLLLLIFALTGWAEMARLTRSLVQAVREREFVTAAIATGASQPRILIRHVLPNIAGPLVTQALLMLPAFLLAEVTLSYFGIGVQEPEASLGSILAAASDLTLLRAQPIAVLSPAIVIFIFVLAIRLIGERKTREAV